MARRALLAAIVAVCGMAGEATAQNRSRMVVWYDPDGSAYLKNNSYTETIKLASYTVISEHNDLLWQDYDGTSGWRAFEDLESQFPSAAAEAVDRLGEAALKMGSVQPQPGKLTESTLQASGLEFSPMESWFIGKPFANNPVKFGNPLPGYSFLFRTTDAEETVGSIVNLPESSTWLLATTAAGLLLASSRWPARSTMRKAK